MTAAVAAVSIKRALPRHSAALATLHAGLFDPPWREDAFARLLAAETTRGRVAIDDGEIVGFVLAQVVRDEAEILALAVAPGHQSRGLGRRLLARMLREAAQSGVTRVDLEVAADNERACRLYASLGFREVGRRLGYYASSPAGHAILMSLDQRS